MVARWLVTGARGALGSDLVDVLRTDGADVVALDRDGLDITDSAAVTEALDTHRPSVVVNAAAYTRVDDAEVDEAAATRVNGDGPGHLARWCVAHAARLVHVSTDYVFEGTATSPYEVDATPAPCNAYGRSKLAGERAVIAAGNGCHVVRTAWVYGTGPSFVRAVGARLRAGETVDVVNDQTGAPTWSLHLARRLLALGASDLPGGVWHCTAGGAASWYEVAVALAEMLGADATQVRPTDSAAFVRPAPRPQYSVLSNLKWVEAGLPSMPHWKDMLQDAVATRGAELIG